MSITLSYDIGVCSQRENLAPAGPSFIPLGSVDVRSGSGHQYDLIIIGTNSNGTPATGQIEAIDRAKNNSAFMVMTSASGGQYTNVPAYLAEPLEDEGSAPAATEDLGWAKSMTDAWTDGRDVSRRQPLALRWTKPGSGFTTAPVAPGDWTPSDNDAYDDLQARISQLKAVAPNVRPSCVCIMMLENEVGNMTDGAFEIEMTNLIAAYRTDLDIPDLPIVLIPPPPDWNVGGSASLRAVYAGLQDTISHIGLADVSALTNAATLHWTPENCRLLGAPIFAAYEGALAHNNPGGAPATPTAPATIADLVVAGGQSVIDLAFTVPANGGASILGYDLETSDDGSTGWITVSPDPISSPYHVSGLVGGAVKFYRVRAYNDAGAGAWSNVDSATASTNVSAPDQFSIGQWSMANLGTGGNARISISSLPNDNGSALTDIEYQINGGSWVSLETTSSGDYDIGGMADDAEYDFSLRAVNGNGNATPSTSKQVTPTTETFDETANLQWRIQATALNTSEDTFGSSTITGGGVVAVADASAPTGFAIRCTSSGSEIHWTHTPSSSYTLTFLAIPSNLATEHGVLVEQNGGTLEWHNNYSNPNARLWAGHNGSSSVSRNNFNAVAGNGVLAMFTLSYDSATQTMMQYHDAVLRNTDVGVTNRPLTATEMSTGWNSNNATTPTNGAFRGDIYGIWGHDVALSEAEVAAFVGQYLS